MIKSHFYPYGQNTRNDPISGSALFLLDWRAVWICACLFKVGYFPWAFSAHFILLLMVRILGLPTILGYFYHGQDCVFCGNIIAVLLQFQFSLWSASLQICDHFHFSYGVCYWQTHHGIFHLALGLVLAWGGWGLINLQFRSSIALSFSANLFRYQSNGIRSWGPRCCSLVLERRAGHMYTMGMDRGFRQLQLG